MFSHGALAVETVWPDARKVTRCVGNILFELDGEPALDVPQNVTLW